MIQIFRQSDRLSLHLIRTFVSPSRHLPPGGRLDPSRVRVVDIFDTHGDAFASNIRQGLRKAGIGKPPPAVAAKEDAEGMTESDGSRFMREGNRVGGGGETSGSSGRMDGRVDGRVDGAKGGRRRDKADAGGGGGRSLSGGRGAGGGGRSLSGIVVVWTDEPVTPASLALTEQRYKKSYYGTISYIPATFGLYISSHIVREVLGAPVSELLSAPTPTPAAAAAAARKASKVGGASKGKAARVVPTGCTARSVIAGGAGVPPPLSAAGVDHDSTRGGSAVLHQSTERKNVTLEEAVREQGGELVGFGI